ncbi:hypothetical protein [Chitinophaga sp. MM2321]|uniref:CIS tube protein n=1 Tax=Chitinophaga sp. MM2321 TaxID=3137178 RepID=UPI0032D58AF4
MPGELKKLKIKAIENGQVTQNPDLMYDALVNPESYTMRHLVVYNPTPPAAGSTGKNQQYAYTAPPDLQFDFLFDSSGVIPQPLGGLAGALSGIPAVGAIAGAIAGATGAVKKYDILADINKFKKVVYVYNGTGHSPRRVQLLWGTLFFEGVLTSLSFNFKLFKPDGTPIRVVATAAFSGTIEDDLKVAMQKSNSPDLTHIRVVKQGDTLPLMTYRIYGSADYYLEVARFNNLTDFRNIRPGDTIKFPPLDKSNQ